MHPSVANGFQPGDRALLESELDSMEVRLKFDETQRADVALTEKGGWLHRGRCANALVRAKTTDDGGGAAYYDTPVRLVPCR